MIPEREQNPKGLYRKYNMTRADGKPLDPKAEFFILRLDELGKDSRHINACRKAVLAYADAIAEYKPDMAKELYSRYNQTIGSVKIQINPAPHF